MGFWDKLFDRKKEKADNIITGSTKESKPVLDNKEYKAQIESYTFSDGTIIENDDEVLDVDSPKTIAMFRNNLKVLITEAKQKGKVEKFYLIREEDFFPENWEWSVLSDQTNLEPIIYNTFIIRSFIFI